MSKTEELLQSLTDRDIALYTSTPETEPHIVVGPDRFIAVPEELRRIAVQYDHNVETVMFDCPRYWDEHDMSQMKIYINYLRKDRTRGMYLADNVTVDDADPNIMHFNWTITKNVTLVAGVVSFLICIKKTNEEGFEENHWNSELNQQMVVSEGLEVEESILENYPDIITQLLTRMDIVELIASPGKIEEYVSESLKDNQVFLDGLSNVVTPEFLQEFFKQNPIAILTLELTLGTAWTEDTVNGYFTQTVPISGVTSTQVPVLDVKLSGNLENMENLSSEWSKIVHAVANDGSITFYASEVTTTNLTVIVRVEDTVSGGGENPPVSGYAEPIDLNDLEKILI